MAKTLFFLPNTVCSEQKFTPKNKHFTQIISVHSWQIACLWIGFQMGWFFLKFYLAGSAADEATPSSFRGCRKFSQPVIWALFETVSSLQHHQLVYRKLSLTQPDLTTWSLKKKTEKIKSFQCSDVKNARRVFSSYNRNILVSSFCSFSKMSINRQNYDMG